MSMVRVVRPVHLVRLFAAIVALLGTHHIHLTALNPIGVAPGDREATDYWTRWRGPSGQGTVANAEYTDTWSDTVNVKWKVDVPGSGHSSQIFSKDQNLLIT